MGIAGEQVVGVVDALHEAVGAGYPDDPSTQVKYFDSETITGCKRVVYLYNQYFSCPTI